MSDHFASGTELKAWAINQIDHDLSAFKKPKFKETDISNIYKDLSNVPGNLLIKFQIIDGVLYSNHNELDKNNSEITSAHNIFCRFFGNMIRNHDFDKNVEFIVSVGERLKVPDHYNFKAPIIVPVKNSRDSFNKYVVMAPDHYTISEWPRLYSYILSANEKYPWNRKIEKAFWRGSSSGGVYTRENWQNFPRVKLVQLSSENPNLIDAKFTTLPQNDKAVMDMLSEKYPLALYVSQADHVKYKIQVSVDGNTTSLSGYLWRLLSNSFVLSQKSTNAQWFHCILKEGQHYVAIEYDMSDLLHKIKWVLDHEEASKTIAFAGSELVSNEITPDHLHLYWSHLLSEYSKLQDFTLLNPSLTKAQNID